jgi:hypothetical protein
MVSWVPAIDATAVEIWAPNKVLNIWTTGSGEVDIVSFRRGESGRKIARTYRFWQRNEHAALTLARHRPTRTLVSVWSTTQSDSLEQAVILELEEARDVMPTLFLP